MSRGSEDDTSGSRKNYIVRAIGIEALTTILSQSCIVTTPVGLVVDAVRDYQERRVYAEAN